MPREGKLKEPPTDTLRSIILENDCILCITMVVGTKLVDAYSLNRENMNV